MASYVILTGRLTQDPEMRYTTTGTPVTSFSVAVDRPYKNKEGQRDTDFFDCSAWRGTGELVAKYFKKGQRIFLNGRLENQSYEAKDGTKRRVTKIIVNSIEFLDSRRESGDTEDVDREPAGVGAGPNDLPDDLPF